MQATILLFGPAADAVGASSVAFDAPSNPTPTALLEQLTTQHAALEPIARGARLAVNGAFVEPDHPIQPGDELALIAMVSGG